MRREADLLEKEKPVEDFKNGAGGWIEENGQYNIKATSPGYWSVFNLTQANVGVAVRGKNTVADFNPLQELSGTSNAPVFIPAGVQMQISVTGLQTGESLWVGRQSAIKPIDLHRVDQD